jgi:2-alkyl-3-oxoalkanoate reductase
LVPDASSGGLAPAVAAGARRYAELEQTASIVAGIEFVALRYGFFYGPGTWFDSAGDMGQTKA